MTRPTLFIDGEHGTTGLQIRDRLKDREDLEIISLDHAERHDKTKRQDLLIQCDFAILCLPDEAAKEAVAFIDKADADTRIIDTSTAHRTFDDWIYGFAEYTKTQAERISKADRVANPGCYSTGAISLLAPLIQNNLIPANYPVTINAISGYTGGGKQMIAQMENPNLQTHIAEHHFAYALSLAHKHVPEITKYSQLKRRPLFTPAVARFAQGMLVNIPLHLELTKAENRHQIYEVLADHYCNQNIVNVKNLTQTDALTRLAPQDMANQDTMTLYVTGNDEHINLIAQLDNLGKGASGAAVQNLNLMLAQ